MATVTEQKLAVGAGGRQAAGKGIGEAGNVAIKGDYGAVGHDNAARDVLRALARTPPGAALWVGYGLLG